MTIFSANNNVEWWGGEIGEGATKDQVDECETKLLEMIGSGVTSFEPLSRTSNELLRFQEMAQGLLKLEKDGLVDRCMMIESEIAGRQYFERVQILRGIPTHAGNHSGR